MRTPIAAAFACALAGASFAQAPDAPRPDAPLEGEALAAGVDELVGRFLERHQIPGASVALVKDGEPVLLRGYGLADAELSAPATEQTVYQLASVTKTFTATAVLLLAKEGKLGLDDPIARHLPDLPKAWEGVTVRNLLNHTSGVKSYTGVPGFGATPHKVYAPRELVDLVAAEPLEFAPGSRWAYSNTGYVVLGMLIERASGRSYGTFLAERIFGPLGLSRTRANDLEAVIPGRARGYRRERGELRNATPVSPSQPFAAGMLVSTVADLARWDAALAGRRILDGPTLEAMWTPARLADGSEAGYGLGWEVSKVNGRRRASHGGAIPGFSTQISRYLDDGLTVIVLANAEGGRADALERRIAGLWLPALAEKPAEAIADPDPDATAKLRGVFEGALRGEFDASSFTEAAQERLVPAIRADRERLASFGALKAFRPLSREERGGRLRLRYRAELEHATVELSFDLDEAGKVAGAGMRAED